MLSARRFSLAAVCLAFSLPADSADQIISTVADIKHVLTTPHSGSRSFVITGVVTSTSLSGKRFAVKDQSGAIEFFHAPRATLSTGDIIRVSGYASCAKGSWTGIKDLQTLGRTQLDPPKLLTLHDLRRPDHELRMVKTRATVIDVIADDLGPNIDFILIRDGQETILAYGPHDPALAGFIDAEVEISGIVKRGISSERKFVGTCLEFSCAKDFRVLTPAPADKFDFPSLPSALNLDPRDIIALNRHVANGTVLAAWNPLRLLIMSDDDRLIVVELSDCQPMPKCGDSVTVAGYPTTDLYRIVLTRARIRINAKSAPKDHGAEDSPSDKLPYRLLDNKTKRFYNQMFGQLVAFRGVVRALPNISKGDYLMLFESDKGKFAIDVTAAPDTADKTQLNSEIEVTGRLIFETTNWQPTDILPRINNVRIVIRKPDDIRVISGPPWLTVRKLMLVVGALLIWLISLFVRGRIRKRLAKIKFKERTQLAVELHDSLSQALTGLACQIVGAQMDDDPASSRRKLTTADQMLQSCRTELRNCLFDLRNDTMAEKSFDMAIRRTLEPLADQVETSIRFNVDRDLFDDFSAHSILAIIRELVANAIRHGHAWTVKIAGTINDGKLLFSVTDDGCGFDPSYCPSSDQGHFGLDGIRERIKRLDGTFEIRSSPKSKTKAVITIPIKQK